MLPKFQVVILGGVNHLSKINIIFTVYPNTASFYKATMVKLPPGRSLSVSPLSCSTLRTTGPTVSRTIRRWWWSIFWGLCTVLYSSDGVVVCVCVWLARTLVVVIKLSPDARARFRWQWSTHHGRLWTQLMGNNVHVTPGDRTSMLNIPKRAAASHFCKRISLLYNQYPVLYRWMMNIPLIYQNGVVSKGGSGALFGQILRVIREIARLLSFQGWWYDVGEWEYVDCSRKRVCVWLYWNYFRDIWLKNRRALP